MRETKEDELLKRRLRELADKCYKNNMYTFTDFLSLADLSVYYDIERELNFVEATPWGGNEICERKILRFGSEKQLGFSEDFPITTLCIKPLMQKFADNLSHRDILGSLMNLGIEREVLGDIFLVDNVAYLFCLHNMADYICQSLTRVRHTTVMCSIVEEIPSLGATDKTEKLIQVNSERLDGVIAKVCNLSRSQCALLFTQRKIFINGRLCENSSRTLKEKDVVTVRGFGRFTYLGISGATKKGKLNIVVEM